jgi:hypothetical protein
VDVSVDAAVGVSRAVAVVTTVVVDGSSTSDFTRRRFLLGDAAADDILVDYKRDLADQVNSPPKVAAVVKSSTLSIQIRLNRQTKPAKVPDCAFIYSVQVSIPDRAPPLYETHLPETPHPVVCTMYIHTR